MITGVAKITLRTNDQERAVQFWVNKLGFALLLDESFAEERWIEVAASDGTRLVLAKSDHSWPESPPGVPDAPVFFECEDLLSTHQSLASNGVTFTTPPERRPFGWWAVFEDPDGNTYALEHHSDQKDVQR